MNKFSKMKVHWWTYNHCLVVSYLTSVAFGYEWITDTEFQKFSDKDWIWIFKKFIRYGSGVKKSISAHLWFKPSTGSTRHLVSTETKIFSFGFSWEGVTSGGVFGLLYPSLDANPMGQYFASSLLWKLDYHPTL